MMMMECQAAIFLPLLQPNHSIHSFNGSHFETETGSGAGRERFKNIAMQAKLVATIATYLCVFTKLRDGVFWPKLLGESKQKFIKIKILSIISNTEVKESLQRAALRPHESVSAAEILTYTGQLHFTEY